MSKKFEYKKIVGLRNKGFTLLVAIVTSAMLLIISFVVVNVALKQLNLSYSNKESQFAFYNTDSGSDCAIYWDLKDPTISPFDPPGPPTSISCNGQSITPSTPVIVNGFSTSTFQVNFTKGCAIVDVVKKVGGNTKIDSHGYNNCAAGAQRRYERGITISYESTPVGGSSGPIITYTGPVSSSQDLSIGPLVLTTPGTYDITISADYNNALVKGVAGGGGGGGGGGNDASAGRAGGGGGGGGSANMTGVTVNLIAGTHYTAVVGSGGSGGAGVYLNVAAGDGTGGGNTSFSIGGLSLTGGSGGTGSPIAGVGGTGGNGGGNGGRGGNGSVLGNTASAGTASASGGGGGGGASGCNCGIGGAGGNGVSQAGGAQNVSASGQAGYGGSGGDNGNDGGGGGGAVFSSSYYGGGGGGGSGTSDNGGHGGAGANGALSIQ